MRRDLECQIRGVLKIFGVKLGKIAPGNERIGFRQGVREAIADDPTIQPALNALLEHFRDRLNHFCFSGCYH